ncbi:hypothetical protein ATCV1_z501R [Acanthocystis turfacea chlorella virus 1]|uniref:Uncharacterized protein z501R n=1 Tax=Chlorovirus heliozoae TaxID=322019 RepID=A7K9B1_9PHYC|nr:hypothetical protein ATCV1_z501R [Acanthocystis turfacea chlorella virus 1]ABT16635.1 hypothetical protein ATCV1_z501R [Acanthocystis turfacea chlorella virus 1]
MFERQSAAWGNSAIRVRWDLDCEPRGDCHTPQRRDHDIRDRAQVIARRQSSSTCRDDSGLVKLLHEETKHCYDTFSPPAHNHGANDMHILTHAYLYLSHGLVV